MPKAKVKGQVSDLIKKEKKEKVKQSNFFLTLNTNQRYKDDDEHMGSDAEYFSEVMGDILNHIEEYVKVPDGHWTDDYIKDVDVQYVIERGTKKGQLHFHALVKFKHNTKVQLDFAKIKVKVQDALGLKSIYFNSKLLKPSMDENIEQYLGKYT